MHRLLLLLLPFTLYAQSPFIYYRGVVNVANYMPPGLPSGGIAQGAQFSIFGANLGPSTFPALTFPLGTTLATVSISVTHGSTTVAAIPVFLSPGQINAIMPSNTPTGLASLRVTYNNFKSNFVPVNIVASAFGIFTSTGTGQGPGSIQNFSPSSVPLNGLNASAQIGQTEILYGVGLGPALGPDNVAPSSANLPTQTEVFVGGVPATLSYSGRAACCSGIDQINFQVPAGAPSGCWVPVVVRTQGTIVSNTVTMAIGQNLNCSEPNNPLVNPLISGGTITAFFAARFSTRHDVNVSSPLEAVADYASAALYQVQAAPYNFNPYVSLPPAGSCTSYSVSGYSAGNFPRLSVSATANALKGGSIAIVGNTSSASIPTSGIAGYPNGNVGGAIPLLSQLPNTLLLNSGTFALTTAGGTGVPALSASFPMPSTFTWNNRDSLASVNRSQPLNISWSGVASTFTVMVVAMGVDLPNNATTVIGCVAHPGDLSLTVPPFVLANLPAAHTRPSQSLGVIFVGAIPLASPVAFSASGISAGQILPAQVLGKSVSFQ